MSAGGGVKSSGATPGGLTPDGTTRPSEPPMDYAIRQKSLSAFAP